MGSSHKNPWRLSPDAIILVAILLVAPTIGYNSASAATSNCGTAGNYFAGRYYAPAASELLVRGARADIEQKQANLCTGGANSESLGQSMLAANEEFRWAQIGWVHKNYGDVYLRYLWEWTGTGGAINQSYFGYPHYDTSDTFTVNRYESDSKIHLLLNGVAPDCNIQEVCPVTGYDPVNQWDGGIHAEWFGESFHPGTDLPGTDSNRMDFLNVETKGGAGNWNSNGFSSPAIEDFCYYHVNTASSSHIKVWTDPLNHQC